MGKLTHKTVKAAHTINHDTASIFLERSVTNPLHHFTCVARAPAPANSPPKRKIRGYLKFGYARIGRMIHCANGAPRNRRKRLVNVLTLFGLFAVTAMLVTYALESRSSWFILAFAVACALGSAYGFLQGAWPFGVVEAIWSAVALRRWWQARAPH